MARFTKARCSYYIIITSSIINVTIRVITITISVKILMKKLLLDYNKSYHQSNNINEVIVEILRSLSRFRQQVIADDTVQTAAVKTGERSRRVVIETHTPKLHRDWLICSHERILLVNLQCLVFLFLEVFNFNSFNLIVQDKTTFINIALYISLLCKWSVFNTHSLCSQTKTFGRNPLIMLADNICIKKNIILLR